MRVAGPIILGVLGAILTFALGIDELEVVSLQTVGIILMAGALIWFIVELFNASSNQPRGGGGQGGGGQGGGPGGGAAGGGTNGR